MIAWFTWAILISTDLAFASVMTMLGLLAPVLLLSACSMTLALAPAASN